MEPFDLKVALPMVIASVSLVVSLFVAYRNWRYSEISIRYASRNIYENAVLDLDRQLANRPELWAIYDHHPMALRRDNSLEAKARREAFIYFHFNLFESVFRDFNYVFRPTKIDRRYWRAWDAWIRHFLRSSSEARELFADIETQDIYVGDFVKYMNSVIRDEVPITSGRTTLPTSNR